MTAVTKEQQFDHMTDAALDELRSEIGKEIVGPTPYVTEVTRDAIRHFASGAGDYNPMWLDEDHARRSPAGTLLAPPFILFALNKVAWGARGLRGIHSMFSGGTFEWRRPIRLGDRLSSRTALKEIEVKQSRFAGRAIKQIREATFVDERGELVAVACPYSFRIERDAAQKKNKYGELAAASYSREDYEKIAAAYRAEVIRGDEPRYFEDVAVGETLPPIVKGPLTVTDIIVWLLGQGGQWLRSHGDAAAWYERHPKGAIRNEFGAFEPPEIVHWDHAFARRVGVPAAYDYGPQRVAWLGNLVTNWMGDVGFLRSMSAEVRRFNLVGDTSWVHGRVTGKSRQEGRPTVELELWVEDQRGDLTTKGTAAVELPSRG
jgi:acyl dehydratase